MNVTPPNSAMTKRELEVLRLLAKGCKDKEIAKELYLSVYTVYSHVKKIFRKLGVTSRTEAACWAMRNGLADNDDTPTKLEDK